MDFRLDEPAWSLLERERRDKPFVVRAGGRVLRFRAAPDVPAGTLLQVAADWRLFLAYCCTDTGQLAEVDLAWWKAEHVLRLYRRHFGLNVSPDADRHLFSMLEQDEYRDAAESDLHQVYRADLGELWRSRQWRKLLGFIDRLPRNSHFGEVLAGDEKLAKQILSRRKKLGEKEPQPERRMSEFTVEAELLSIVADRLAELTQVTVATKGGKSRTPKPLPRPKSAMARLKEQAEQLHVQFTLDRVFGLIDAQGRPTGKGAA